MESLLKLEVSQTENDLVGVMYWIFLTRGSDTLSFLRNREEVIDEVVDILSNIFPLTEEDID